VKVALLCSVALKHRQGVAFGTAEWLDGDRIQFEAHARIAEKETVEMRMELRGEKDTVYALVEIGAISRRSGEIPRFIGRIVSIQREDKDRLAVWIQETQAGGTSLDPTARLEQMLAEAEQRGSATAEEIGAVLDRMDERRSRSRFRKADYVPTLGIEQESADGSTSRDQDSGRHALKDALRTASRHDSAARQRAQARAIAKARESQPDEAASTGSRSTGSVSWFERSASMLKDRRKQPADDQGDGLVMVEPGFGKKKAGELADLDDLDFLDLNPEVVSTPPGPGRARPPPSVPSRPPAPQAEPPEEPPPPSSAPGAPSAPSAPGAGFRHGFDEEEPPPLEAPPELREDSVETPAAELGVDDPYDLFDDEPADLIDDEVEELVDEDSGDLIDDEPEAEPPEFDVDFGSSRVEVRWASQAAFAASWNQELKNLGLRVPAGDAQLPYLHQPFTVVLVPPGEKPITLRAGVVAQLDGAFGLGLELTGLLKERLERLATLPATPSTPPAGPAAVPPPAETPAPATGPDFDLDLASREGRVSWSTMASFAETWEAELHQKSLMVPVPPPHPPLYSRFDLDFEVAHRQVLRVRGTVVTQVPHGFGLHLTLSSADVELLEALSGS